MPTNTVSPQIQGLIHAVLALVLAALVARGAVSAADGATFEPLVEAALAALAGVAMPAFAMYQKKVSDQAAQVVGQIAFAAGSQPGVEPVDKDHPAAVSAGQRALLAAGIKN